MTEAKKGEDGRHRGLGRGLSALIGDDVALPETKAEGGARSQRTLPVGFLRPNRFQPRKDFDGADLMSLADSIREKGVLQPILVRPIAGEADAFEIVAGERRWRAAQLAKLHDVPVVVREVSDAESLELAIVENIQRSDLNPIEEATAYRELMEKFRYTQERMAAQVGKSRSHVANSLRLLTLPLSVQKLLWERALTAGHGRTLVGLPQKVAEARALAIMKTQMSVRQAEHGTKPKPPKTEAPARKDADTKSLETSLTNVLGLKVEIAHKGSTGGELKIAYRTLEQLDDVIRRLGGGV